MVEGLPGVGKSYWVAGLCKELEDQGKRLCVIAKTHASCANFNAHLSTTCSNLRAITADHWAHAYIRRGRCPFDCAVIEEASMINSGLWDEIAKASMLVLLPVPSSLPSRVNLSPACGGKVKETLKPWKLTLRLVALGSKSRSATMVSVFTSRMR